MSIKNEAIGIVIRRLRQNKGLSQDTLSGLADIARTHLSMIETGDKQPNLDTICKIADAFGIKSSELVSAFEKESEKM